MQYVIKRFKEENRIKRKIRKGPSRKLTKHEERFIIRKIFKNLRSSAVKVSAEFNKKFSTSISPKTLRRVLREAELHGRSARKNFLLVRKTESLGFHLQIQ